MKVLYRISDNGYKKPKFERATKKRCLLNFLSEWPLEEIVLFVDKVIPETMEFIDGYKAMTGLNYLKIEAGSSAASWRVVMNYALENFKNDDVVYFVEDDYWHLPNSRAALLEAVERADYVTLYDAPDKYVPASLGGNPLIEDDGADATRVILTPSSHWRLTNSTTMTFACKVGTLRADADVWNKWTSGDHPHDFQAFLELRQNGRALLSPIPSLATHCEPAWKSPLIQWEEII